MFHCMFSTTFKLVQPQFVPIYTVGLFQLRAMASSSPTTSIPIQEPGFLQFLHDVHHAYLLLHRAMALLPPTLIPNVEPTPLPSTDVWHQPDGLRPHYSERTNAFIDAVHIPSPDLAEEETLMDELVEPNLPDPHQHVAAPPPDALPDPSKLSTTASTPAKRKPNAKATPKAPAKRRRRTERSRSRSSSPLSTWTFEDKQKLRTLKADEKSRFSWRVISTKMGKSEADVRSMWNKIKDKLG
jgi:phage tail protein X